MASPTLSFNSADDPNRIEEFHAATAAVLDGNLETEKELFGRLAERGFPVPDQLNNLPAILLARFSPMINAALQLAEIKPKNSARETIHALVKSILDHPMSVTISRVPATQTSILKGVQAEFDLRSAAMDVESAVVGEYGSTAGKIALPPVVGNEPMLQALRAATPEARTVEHVVILTIRHVALEHRMSLYDMICMSR